MLSDAARLLLNALTAVMWYHRSKSASGILAVGDALSHWIGSGRVFATEITNRAGPAPRRPGRAVTKGSEAWARVSRRLQSAHSE